MQDNTEVLVPVSSVNANSQEVNNFPDATPRKSVHSQQEIAHSKEEGDVELEAIVVRNYASPSGADMQIRPPDNYPGNLSSKKKQDSGLKQAQSSAKMTAPS